MRPIPEHELQRVLARRQGHGRLSLAFAEMEMMFVHGKRAGEVLRFERGIDQQMMMADVRFFDARRGHPHVRSEPEDHLERAGDGLAIM